MFLCQMCGLEAVTIRGMCRACAPALHAEHEERLAAYDAALTAFMRLTGRHPLEDWDAFETWLETEARDGR
jgi:hypothetical protein